MQDNFGLIFRTLHWRVPWLLTIRHENITYPKRIFSNYFPITVSRFRFLRINFRKLTDTYCICVSCVTLYPVGTPVLVELFLITVTRFESFRINWVMFSWQMVVAFARGTRTKTEWWPHCHGNDFAVSSSVSSSVSILARKVRGD